MIINRYINHERVGDSDFTQSQQIIYSKYTFIYMEKNQNYIWLFYIIIINS